MNRFSCVAIITAVLLSFGSCSKGTTTGGGGSKGGLLDAVQGYDFNRADSLLAEMAAKDSTAFTTTYSLGFSYEHQFMFYDALLAYLKTVAKYPDSVKTFEGLNRVFTYLGSPDEAAEAAHRWFELAKGNTEARLRYIRALTDAGQYDKAAQQLEEARKVGLDKACADLLQARLMLIANQYDDAARVANPAAAQATPECLLVLADYYDERGQIDSAMQAGQRAYDMGHDQFYGMVQFQRACRHKYVSTARAYVNEIQTLDKSRAAYLALLVMFKRLTDDRSGTIDLASELANIRPGLYTPLFLNAAAGWVYFNATIVKNNLDLIVAMANRTQAAAPGSFQDFINWEEFKYYRWPADPRGVAIELGRTRGWREGLPRYHAYLLAPFVMDTSRTKLYAKVDSAAAANKERLPFVTQMGWTFNESMGPGLECSNHAFSFVLKEDPLNCSAFLGLAGNYLFMQKYQEAAEVCASYAPIAERYPEAGLTKAVIDLYSGKVAEGISSFEKNYPFARDSKLTETFVQKLLSLGKGSEAQQIVARCLQVAPSDPDLQALASDLNWHDGNDQGSLDAAAKGLQFEPNSARLTAYKARALYGLGRKEDCYKLFDSILAVDSYDPYCSLLYSRVLAEENKNPDKAQNLARQAVLIVDPTQQPTLNLAYVYLKTGRPDLATGAGMRGVEMYPQDPEAYFLLGWSQSAANKPGAKENLQKAISLGLTGSQLQAAKEMLAKN